MDNEINNQLYTGSCLCGSVKYSIKKIEHQMAHCHCSMCRKYHGAAFATFGSVKADNFQWLSGENCLQEYVADNGTKRLFCKKCGSSLIFIPSVDSGEYVEFALGTLDSDITIKPDAHIYTNYKACWFQITDQLPQYPEGRGSSKIT